MAPSGPTKIPREAYNNARHLDDKYKWPTSEARRLTPYLPPEKEDEDEFRCTGYDKYQVQQVSAKQLWATNPFYRNSAFGKILTTSNTTAKFAPFGSGAERDLDYIKFKFDEAAIAERKAEQVKADAKDEVVERDRLRSMAKDTREVGYRVTSKSAKKRRTKEELIGHYEEMVADESSVGEEDRYSTGDAPENGGWRVVRLRLDDGAHTSR